MGSEDRVKVIKLDLARRGNRAFGGKDLRTRKASGVSRVCGPRQIRKRKLGAENGPRHFVKSANDAEGEWSESGVRLGGIPPLLCFV